MILRVVEQTEHNSYGKIKILCPLLLIRIYIQYDVVSSLVKSLSWYHCVSLSFYGSEVRFTSRHSAF